MFAMSRMLRNLMCLCFVGMIVGTLWFFAQSSNTPTIPPWTANESSSLRAYHAHTNAEARADPDPGFDFDDTTTAAFDGDCEFGGGSI
jgi:hypothetical protein